MALTLLINLGKWVLSNWKVVALILLVSAVAFYVYNAIYDRGAAHVQGQWDAAVAQQAKAAAGASTAYQKRIARLNALTDGLAQQLEDEIAKNAVYRDCVVPDDGLHTLNQLIATGAR